ncbi:OLC1v1002692C1 [Oldenlandia corymbosa var. corymbosa]|uniref:OLC1v1002692C1 n=1 Tax=Oldenlandia corymbosa var. corymbosa TaxID=529605 RepID=A0AAV1D8A1_OLDCO|nr:OLC1v1002692C1 [Oldenlandia corymbosa var. corymbosa]
MRHVGVQIQIEGGANRRVFANIHINKKGRCQLYGNPLEEFFRDIGLGPSTIMHIVYQKDANVLRIFHFYNDVCQRLSHDDTANIGNCYLLSLDLNTASRCDIRRRYFGTIGWPSLEKTARVIEDNGNPGFFLYLWKIMNFQVFKGNNGKIFMTGTIIGKGEIEIVDYIRCNTDKNIFFVIMTNELIDRGRLEIPWYIVRRLAIEEYENLILYYDHCPIISMRRYHMPESHNRFVVEGDIRAIMDMKKILVGIKLGFRINAKKVANKEALILEVL